MGNICPAISKLEKLKIFKAVMSGKLDEVKKTLSSLTCDIDDIINYCKTLEKVIKANNPAYSFITDSAGLILFLTNKTSDSTPIPIDTPYKELTIDNPEEANRGIRKANTWLHKAWGQASLSRIKFVRSLQRDFSNEILNTLSLNSENPEKLLNKAVKDFVTVRLSRLKSYFDSLGIDTSTITYNMPYDYGVTDPNDRINRILKEYRKYFYNSDGTPKLSFSELSAFENSNTKEYDRLKAEAFANYLIIDPVHFDFFVKNHLSTLQIKNSNGKLTPADNKYGIKLGHGKENTSWLDEDRAYIISNMVDSLVQTKISTWPVYRKSGKVWLPSNNEYATTNHIVNTFAKIMSIPTLKIGDIYDKENSPLVIKLKETFKDVFGYKETPNGNIYIIDEIIDKYINRKRIGDIISSIPLDWERLIPVSMFLLCEEEQGQSILENSLLYDSNNPSKLFMNDNEIAFAMTIYKNMLDPTNGTSLINQTVANDFDIYQMIGQVFLTHERKELFGITETLDGVQKNYYSIGRANQRLNYLQNILNGYYCPLKDVTIPRTKIENNFDEKDKITTITIEPFKLEGTPNKYQIEISNGSDIKFFINGKQERLNDLKAQEVLKELTPFFLNALHLNFDGLIYIYKGILGGESVGYNAILKNLTQLSAKFIYGYEVSKKLGNLNTPDFKNELKEYYKKVPKLVGGVSYNQVNVFNDIYPIITRLSLANDINSGYAGDVMVKGGAGETINLVVLHSLSTAFHSFLNEKSRGENSAISHFSVRNAAKRISFFRDYVNKKGDVKSATTMSPEEFFFASFFYDFYGLENSSSNESVYGTTIGVLSDKPNLARLEIFRNAQIQVGTNKETGEPIIKKIKDLSAHELKTIAIRELGIYYLRMYEEIKRNLVILNNYSELAKGNQEFYNIDNDYINTRGFSKSVLKLDIHNAILAAQKAREDLEINDFLYFLWDKKGNLHAKLSIFAELSKHDIIVGSENSSQFFKRKEAEFVVNLLLDLKQGIRFTDSDGLQIDSDAIRTMLRKNRKKGDDNKIDYKSKDNWATIDNIIIAKIMYGDSFKDLTTKNSITKWSPYIKLMLYVTETGDSRIDSSNLDINGEFDILYFLLVLNKYLDDINNHFKVKKLKNIIKKDSKEVVKKKSKPATQKDKEYLKLKYTEWILNKIKSGETEFTRRTLSKLLGHDVTDEELLNNYIENYIQTDQDTWNRRKINLTVEELNIDSLNSLKEIEDFITRTKLKKSKEFNEEFNKESEKRNYSLSINPELLRYNTLNYLFSEEGLDSTVGSHVNHEVKPGLYTENLPLLSAIETSIQTKRNVALSGAKNQYTRGDINGMGPNMRIAVMEDPKYSISTINGYQDSGAIKALDGATIGNYIARQEELYSLGSLKAGVDNSKPLGNDLNERTGTGAIIKTAEFALVNWRIRNSDINIRLHRIMNNIPWDSNFDGDFLHNYDGDEINYDPVIVYSPAEDAYFLRCNFGIIQNLDGTLGNVSFDEIRIDNEFLKVNKWNPGLKVSEEELDRISALKAKNKNGEEVDRVRRHIQTTRPIRTNYELWDLFGGAYSARFVNGELVYADDNTSLDNITKAAHNVGVRTTKGLLTRPTNADVWLPLKEAKIDWIVTAGAMKLGAANINSIAMLTDDNYQVTTQLFGTADIGMLLNPEHETDSSTVTLMTLVINALGLRGFSADQANKVYEALFNLTEISLKDLFDGIQIELDSLNNTQLKNAMSTLLLKSIIGTTETDGDLLSAIVLQLKDEERNGHDYDIIKDKLPISDPYILNKIVSNFASTMTKFGIRIKFPGSMNVLCPSEGMYKIKGGRLLKVADASKYIVTFNEDGTINHNDLLESNAREREAFELELNNLLAESELNPKLLYEINIGTSYFVRYLSNPNLILNLVNKDVSPKLIEMIENGESIEIDSPSTYYTLRDALKGEQYTLVEDVKKGRELAPYNNTFETTTGEHFMLWDLDPIKHIHMAENDPEAIENIRLNVSDAEIIAKYHIDPNALDRSDSKIFLLDFKRLIHREKLLELNAIGSGNVGRIYVDGQVYRVKKGSIKVSPYEFVASANYATTFGLLIGDDVSEIEKDRLFFLKRFLNKYDNISATEYDIVLRTISGLNYYFMFKDDNSIIPQGLTKISDEEFYNSLDWNGDKVYRLDLNGNRLYTLPYTTGKDGKVKFNAEIYVDEKGNEIIYTSNLTSFLNGLNYNNIDFGRHFLLEHVNAFEIIKQIGEGRKRETLKFYDELTDENTKALILANQVDSTVLNNIKGIVKSIIDLRQRDLLKLLNSVAKGEEIDPTFYGPLFRQVVRSAIETHTSFIKSLDYIVSRTPAQSHLSFMPMKLVGFDLSGKNSAYVNRWLFYLQGSDLDVDKASLLGSVFLNGKFIRWSPFMKLDTFEHLRASETLPFPTGKTLEVVDLLNNRIYDKMDKPIHLVWINENSVEFILPDYEQHIHLYKNLNGIWITDLTSEILQQLSPMSRYVIKRAITDKIPLNEQFLMVGTDWMMFGFDSNGVKNLSYNYEEDFNEFIGMFSNMLYEQFDLYNPVNILELSVLINAFNSFGMIPNDGNELTKLIKEKVDLHNTYFNGRNSDDSKNAVINFVSSNVFLISCDPVNLVQAMTSVDYQTEIIKGIAAQSPLAKQATHYDKGNTMTTFRLARLTLSGKQNTGIEASSLKVYETYNQYVANVLNYGTDEELKRLISTPRNIAGFIVNLPANAYCKNIANVHSKEVYDELMKINLDEDSALWLSAMLSLSTDNAKDPTLSKINANPEMIGLYNAGYTLGLPVELLRKVIMSKTGMAIAEVLTGNIFLGKSGENTVTRAILYIENGPDVSYIENVPFTLIKNVLKAYGVDSKELNVRQIVRSIIPNKFNKQDIYKARKMISVMKSKAFGDTGENLDYELPSLNSEISKKLKKRNKSLAFYNSEVERILNIISEKESQKRGHKRDDDKLLKSQVRVEELTRDILELEDIQNTLRDTEKIPNKSGGMYDWAANFLKYMDNISEVDMNLKNIPNFLERQDTIRNIKKFFLDMDSYLDILELIQLDEGIDGIDGNHYYSLQIIKELNEMANEMSTIRPILSLNQQLPNSKETQLSFIRKFENSLEDRLSSEDTKLDSIKTLEKLNEKYNRPKHTISLVHFIFNDEYREAAIKAYDDVKYKINVLDCIARVPHYFGYLKTMAAYHYGLSQFSVQYRMLNEIAEKVIRGDMRISSRKDTEQYLKRVSKFISREINNTFLLTLQVVLNLPNIGQIILGTNEGNIAFKNWMDTKVIPYYKQMLSNNAFIQSLEEVAYKNSDNRNTILNYTPGVNSMSSDDADILRFSEIALAFSQLSTIKPEKDSGLPLTDLFFYYDLISYDRQPSQLSFTPLFNNIFGTNALIQRYIKYMSELDLNGKMPIILDNYNIDRIKRYIAPEVSIYAINEARTEYIFVKDLENNLWSLLKRKPREVNRGGNLNDDIDLDNYYDYEDYGFEEMFNNDIMEDFGNSEYQTLTLDSILRDPNCKYELVASGYNIRNPYLENNKSKQLSVLEKFILSPNRMDINGESVEINEDGSPVFSEGFIELFNQLFPEINPLEVFITKISTDKDGTKKYVFDSSHIINILENPCK